MKTQVMNNRWNGIETVSVWFEDEMSVYEIIDNENNDTVTTIYDGEYLDTDGQVDYDRLYDAIADAIETYAEKKYAEMEAEQTQADEAAETEPAKTPNKYQKEVITMKATKYTNKELVEIYKNLKTSAKILGFSSASDSEMIAEIEIEAIKRHLNLVDGTVEETAERQTAEQETVEGISKAETTTEMDDSGFEYYSVETAYEVDFRDKQSEVFKTYAEAEQTAGNDTFIEEVDIITRNDKKAQSRRDKQKFEAETAEIEARCIWYDYNGLKGMIAQDTKKVIKKPETKEKVIENFESETFNIAKAEEKKTQFDFYNVAIGFEVEKFISTIPADYESLGIYSDYEKAVQAAQAAADEYGAENIYFHTVEIATLNDEEVYDRDDYEDFIEERETIRHNWYTLMIVDTGKREYVNLDKPVRLDFKE